MLLDNEHAELNISLNATTPVSSRDSAVRHGMPDLKGTVEIGPSLDLHLWRSSDQLLRLDLRLPLRAALTIESPPHTVGWFFAPRMNIDMVNFAGHTGLRLGLLAGPLFADQRHHQYFYGVAPQFAAADRPTYEATGGYSGFQVLASMSKRYPGYWVGAFIRYDTLRGAVFAPGPLVRSNHYLAAGIGIAWMVGRSSKMVDITDEDP
jgi:outer membrane scaffolding protein for murein synthesis (MipA/OmpV family)